MAGIIAGGIVDDLIKSGPVEELRVATTDAANNTINNILLKTAENIPVLGDAVKSLENLYNEGKAFASDKLKEFEDFIEGNHPDKLKVDLQAAKEHPETMNPDIQQQANEAIVEEIHGPINMDNLENNARASFRGLRKDLQDGVNINEGSIDFSNMTDNQRKIIIGRVLRSDALTNSEKHLLLDDIKNNNWKDFIGTKSQKIRFQKFVDEGPESTYDLLQQFREPPKEEFWQSQPYQGTKGMLREVEETKPDIEESDALREEYIKTLPKSREYYLEGIDQMFNRGVLTEAEADNLRLQYNAGSDVAKQVIDDYVNGLRDAPGETTAPKKEILSPNETMDSDDIIRESDVDDILKELEEQRPKKNFIPPPEPIEFDTLDDGLERITSDTTEPILPEELMDTTGRELDGSFMNIPESVKEITESALEKAGEARSWLGDNIIPIAAGAGVSGTALYTLEKLFGKDELSKDVGLADLSILKDLASDVDMATQTYNNIRKFLEETKEKFNNPTTDIVKNNETKIIYEQAKKQEQDAAKVLDEDKQKLVQAVKKLDNKNKQAIEKENKIHLMERQQRKQEEAQIKNDLAVVKQAVRTEDRINKGLLNERLAQPIKINVSPNISSPYANTNQS